MTDYNDLRTYGGDECKLCGNPRFHFDYCYNCTQARHNPIYADIANTLKMQPSKSAPKPKTEDKEG